MSAKERAVSRQRQRSARTVRNGGTMVLVWVAAAAGAFGQTMPAVQGTTLSGTAVDLPATLAAERTVLVCSFLREHKETSNAWRPKIQPLAAAGKVDWLEVAFLNVPTPVGMGISAAMAWGIDDPVAEAHIVPVYASGDGLRTALGITTDREVVVLVVDKAGLVKAKVSGPPTDAAVAAVQAALK